MRVACWISKVTRAHPHAQDNAPANPHTYATSTDGHMHAPARARTHAHTCVILLFHGNRGFLNAPQYIACCLTYFFTPKSSFEIWRRCELLRLFWEIERSGRRDRRKLWADMWIDYYTQVWWHLESRGLIQFKCQTFTSCHSTLDGFKGTV